MSPVDSRDYWRDRSRARGWGGTPVTWGLIIANFALWMLFASSLRHRSEGVFGFFFEGLALRAEDVVERGRVWQLLTYAFLHAPGSVMHVAWNMVVLFFFGREIESMLGRRAYLRVYLGSGLAAGLLAVPWAYLVREQGIPLVGASGCTYGVMVAFACRRPFDRVWWGIPAWGLVAFLVGLQVATIAFVDGDLGAVAHVGGAAFGWLHFRWGGSIAGAWERRRLARGAAAAEAARLSSDADRRRLDVLLARINESGISALTSEEREFLRRASETFRR